MVNRDSQLITVRRSTLVRAGVVVLILVALGVGTVIGLAVGSRSTPPTAKSAAARSSTSRAHVSTTTSLPTTATTVAALPSVLSCGPGSKPHLEPTKLTIGCATEGAVVTGITWTLWGSVTGGQGTGTLVVGLNSTPAIVVVFHAVNGVFQDVSVTPTKDASAVPTTAGTTTSTTGLTTTPTTGLTTTPTTGGLSPVAASQPGTGWGGD